MLRSARYMDYVREHSCCACSMPGPSDPHHAATGGRGIKADDYTCIPLCRSCHNTWHSSRRFRGVPVGGEQVFILRAQMKLMKTYTYLLENNHGSEEESSEEGRAQSAQSA